MPSHLLTLDSKPNASYMIAGWKPQWSDGGEISSGLPEYLIKKFDAKKIGRFTREIAMTCYPFQVPGTHDAFRPSAAFAQGLPTREITRDNSVYDAGNGLIVFQGEEPWFRLDMYSEAFFGIAKELNLEKVVVVEGYNGPAPPEMERSVNCSFSQPEMKEELEKYSVRFSSYGSDRKAGPTIGMGLVSMAHYQYPEINMIRFGAMAPMYSFITNNNGPVGISRDHRSFYDILRRIRALLGMEIDLSDLREKGDAESQELQATLERIASTNTSARQALEQARADFHHTPYIEPVELAPELDRALDDILRNVPEHPEEES